MSTNFMLLCKVGNFSNSTATERHQPCDTLHIPCFPMVGRPRRPNQRRNRLAVVTSGRQPGATSHGVAGRWCSCSSSTVRLLGSCSRLHGDIGHLFLFQSNAGYILFHICTFTTVNSTAGSNINPLTWKKLAALPFTLQHLTHTAD
jgi:hypothetical protein